MRSCRRRRCPAGRSPSTITTAPWLPADVIRRAVAIPAGAHHVAWRYAAPGLPLGLVLAGLGIALLVALSLRVELRTDRLILRPYAITDYDDSAAMWGDAEVVRYIGNVPATREQSWYRTLRYLGHWAAFGFGMLAVRDRDGRFVGDVGITDFKRDIDSAARRARGRLGRRAASAGPRLRDRGAGRRASRGSSARRARSRHRVHDRSAERAVASRGREARLRRGSPRRLSRRGGDDLHSPEQT